MTWMGVEMRRRAGVPSTGDPRAADRRVDCVEKWNRDSSCLVIL